MVPRWAGQAAVVGGTARGLIPDADHIEGPIHVDRGPRGWVLHHVDLMRGVAVRVGFGADHGGFTPHLGERRRLDLGQGVAGERRLAAALIAAAGGRGCLGPLSRFGHGRLAPPSALDGVQALT